MINNKHIYVHFYYHFDYYLLCTTAIEWELNLSCFNIILIIIQKLRSFDEDRGYYIYILALFFLKIVQGWGVHEDSLKYRAWVFELMTCYGSGAQQLNPSRSRTTSASTSISVMYNYCKSTLLATVHILVPTVIALWQEITLHIPKLFLK